jgi:hypothetical protein
MFAKRGNGILGGQILILDAYLIGIHQFSLDENIPNRQRVCAN